MRRPFRHRGHGAGYASEARGRAQGQARARSSTTARPTIGCARKTAAPTSCTPLPTRTMLADALAQYLVWKKWPRWLLVVGPETNDQAARRSPSQRSAKHFGGKIVEERHVQVSTRQPPRRRRLRADPAADPDVHAERARVRHRAGRRRGQVFGDYLPFRTWVARPVAGTSGLVPSSWHPATRALGRNAIPEPLQKARRRIMRPVDYDAWVATRAIGEAASRTQIERLQNARRLHAVAEIRGRRLQRRRPSASATGTASYANRCSFQRPSCSSPSRRSGLPASVQRARHARHR